MLRSVQFTPTAQVELAALEPRFRKPVAAAIELLEHQADLRGVHRHPLDGRLFPHWQIEVGEYRVYYRFDAESVTVNAVRLKGKKRTKEIFKPATFRAARAARR